MPRKNNEVCITAASVAMGGTVNIASTLAIATKARLDSIAIKGNCECDHEEVRPPTPEPCARQITADIVFLVDRSESITQEIWETIKEFLGETISTLSSADMNKTLDAEVNQDDVHIETNWHFSVRGFGQTPDAERWVTGLMGEPARQKVLEWEHDNRDGTYTHLAIDTLCDVDIPNANVMTANADIKAAVVVTDGLSKKADLTAASADKLKQLVDFVFGVSIEGVSNYTADEEQRMKDEIAVISSKDCHLSLEWNNLNDAAHVDAEKLAAIMRKTILNKALNK